MNKHRLWLAAAVAAVITFLIPATALATTGTARPSAPAGKPAPTVSVNTKHANCHLEGRASHCSEMQQLSLKDLTPAQRTERQRAMAKLASHAKAKGDVTAQSAISAPSQCNFSSTQFAGGAYTNPSRFLSCSDSLWWVYSYVIENGVPVVTGSFYFEDQSWNLYSATSLSWTHEMQTIGYTGSWGTFADGFIGTLFSACYAATACSSASLTVSDPQPVSIMPGDTTTYAWTESDTGPAATASGNTDTMSALGVIWNIDTPQGVLVAEETGFLIGRCDSTLGSTGCVDQYFAPTLSLSLSQYGAGAAIISWAQNNLTGWGTNSPLTRLANKTTRNSNRRIICRDGTFGNMGSVIGGNDGDTDSCDEFPFAATNQSGASNGVTAGSQCAQVVAVQTGNSGNEAADWSAVAPVNGTYSPSALCVRGHIPRQLNVGVGQAFGQFVLAQRVLGDDPFYVNITP